MHWAVDEDCRYIFVNAEYERVMGVRKEDCLGKLASEVQCPHVDATSRDRIRRCDASEFESGELHFELNVRVDGEPRSLRVTKFTFEGGDGRTFIGGSAIDTTDLQRVSSELDSARERSEIMARSADCGLWDWNITTGETTFDDRYYAMLGHQPDAFPMTYAAWRALVHPDDIAATEARLRDYLEGNAQSYRAPHRLLRSDGSWRWVVGVGEVTRRDPDGRPIRMVGVHIDIDDLKQAEAALARLNEDLSAKNDELESRNSELDQFSHAASHDLRSPLRAVTGFTEIVRDAIEDGDLARATASLERIEGASERMGRLIDSLLMFATVGRGTLRFESVSLAKLIDQVTQDLAPGIASALALVTTASDLPEVEGDATMLRQVFQNLLENALKYRGREPLRIDITSSIQDGDVTVTIKDNGLGFEQNEADRAFRAFQRLHAGTALVGSGLGLSICKRVIERHGGSISATGAPSNGAAFSVTLPLRQVEPT